MTAAERQIFEDLGIAEIWHRAHNCLYEDTYWELVEWALKELVRA